ncbi:MAG TPA: adenylate/guanylate cyclase domain-containing protein, partial [Acidimicrobiales bacterium]|nr:adenylate/guanylate cyclase domain-containing protein [Acidimicrobiales bacterium]
MAGLACASCDADLPAGARFCPACGSVSSPAAAERRVVTVVFADLAGFTTMAEGRDPEAVKELLDACFGRLVPVIEAHGGVVDKIIGDELMAVFGAPRAHEDDPERAVRAGLALLEALSELDPSLEMRVGINTGEVLAGPVGPGGAYTVTGDTVNTAHRLVGVARRGSVMVAERTHAATAHAIAYGAPASLRLRGRQEPVVAHRALRVRHRLGVRPRTSTATAMVGRAEQLDALVGVVERSVEQHLPHLVVVTGEPGVGKSRLVDGLAAVLPQRVPVARLVVVSCTAYGTEGPLAPFANIIRLALDVPERGSPEEQRAAVRARIDELDRPAPTRARLTARTQQLLGLADHPAVRAGDLAPGRHAVSDDLTAAASAVLDALAAQGPLVLVIDDAQSADRVVIEQIEKIPTWVAERAVTVLAVGRDPLTTHHPRLAAPRTERHLVLALEPLGPEASRELLGRTLSAIDGVTGTVSPAAEAQILAAAGGNPLLLDQLVRYLRESGFLEAVEGGWRAAGPLAEAGLPDGIRALLGARLDGLPDEERTFLQDAAVVGASFTRGAMEALGQTVDEDVVTSLQAKGLLQPSTHPEGLEFRHAPVRDAAYASVPLAARAARHAALARWLVGDHHEPGGQAVARHLERVVSLQQDLGGPPDPEILHLAARHLIEAARAARQRDELREAEWWYERVRGLRLVGGQAEVLVTLEHAQVLLALRRLADAEQAFRFVVDAAPDRTGTHAEACTGLGLALRLQGGTTSAAEWFDAARAAWRAAGDGAGEARAVRTHGWAELIAGRPRAALAMLLRARELEDEHGSPGGLTLQSLAWCEYLIGDHHSARQHLWEAAQALWEAGERAALGWCFGILGNSLWQEGRVEQARTIAENLLVEASSGSEAWGEGMCLVLLAVCRLEAGEPEGAEETARSALRAFAELDDAWGESMARLVQAMVQRVTGDLPAAVATLERGLRTAQRVGAVGSEARLRAELAATLLDCGDERGAEREARATLDVVSSGGGDRDSEIRALVVLAKRARSLG